jgi:hypothetical protein
MFYVYSRVYGFVYEPAEGGYYVETSTVDECFEHETIEAAMKDFLEWKEYVEKQGCVLYKGITEIRTIKSKVYDDEAPGGYFVETRTAYPWVRYDTKYIGDGFSIEISDVKPEDHFYEGYC